MFWADEGLIVLCFRTMSTQVNPEDARMRSKSMRTMAVSLTIAFSVACMGAVLAYGASAAKQSRHTEYGALPSFRILERTMGAESAVVSVAMRRLDAALAKKVAQYLVEQQLSTSRKEARIYFYREGASVSRDEPQHEITWAARRGYTLEY